MYCVLIRKIKRDGRKPPIFAKITGIKPKRTNYTEVIAVASFKFFLKYTCRIEQATKPYLELLT